MRFRVEEVREVTKIYWVNAESYTDAHRIANNPGYNPKECCEISEVMEINVTRPEDVAEEC